MCYFAVSDTSDEEFVGASEALAEAELSEACSDLEEEEGGVAWEEPKVVCPEDDEGEDVGQPFLGKRKHTSLRLLDSDDEDDEDEDDDGDNGDDEASEDEGCGKNPSKLMTRQEYMVESSMPPLRLDSVGGSGSPDPCSPPPSPSLAPKGPLPEDSGIGHSLEHEASLAESLADELAGGKARGGVSGGGGGGNRGGSWGETGGRGFKCHLDRHHC